MKYKWPTGYISRMALAGFILGINTGFAATPRAVAVQTAAEVDALNARGADYGPPADASFPERPFTVPSGTSGDLTGGPKLRMRRLSCWSSQLRTPAWHLWVPVLFDLIFDNLPSVSIEANNFFSTAANWFPARVRGIGNGAVNGNINRLVGNAANSGAEGVTPIPESNPMALLGVGTIGLMGVMAVRRRRYHYRKV